MNKPTYKATSGVFKAASDDSTEINGFLLETIDPFVGAIATVPDLNMTSSILKSQRTSLNINCPTSYSGSLPSLLFLQPFHSDAAQIRVYLFDASINRYVFMRVIDQDEPLNENFLRFRFISGATIVQSATLSGSTYTIAGTINSINYQDLPDMSSLTYNNLISFARDNRSTLSAQAASEGVITMSVPDDDYSFRIPETSNELRKDDVVYLNDSSANWKFTTSTAASSGEQTFYQIFWDSDTTAGTKFPNAPFGWVEINLDFTVNFTFTGTLPDDTNQYLAQLKSIQRNADPSAWTFSDTTTVLQAKNIVTAYVGNTTIVALNVTFHDLRYYVSDLKSLLVTLTQNYGGPPATYQVTHFSSQIQFHSVYRLHSQGPGSIVAMDGLQLNQQITVNSMSNYEVVPNSNLARNVATSNSESMEDNMQMEVTEYIVANAPKVGIAFLYNLQEYRLKKSRGDFLSLSDRDTSTYRAASFGSVMSSLYKLVKPILRTSAPLVGSALGQGLSMITGVPGIGMVGSQVGQSLADRYLSASANPDTTYQCSTTQLQEPVPLPPTDDEFDLMRATIEPLKFDYDEHIGLDYDTTWIDEAFTIDEGDAVKEQEVTVYSCSSKNPFIQELNPWAEEPVAPMTSADYQNLGQAILLAQRAQEEAAKKQFNPFESEPIKAPVVTDIGALAEEMFGAPQLVERLVDLTDYLTRVSDPTQQVRLQLLSGGSPQVNVAIEKETGILGLNKFIGLSPTKGVVFAIVLTRQPAMFSAYKPKYAAVGDKFVIDTRLDPRALNQLSALAHNNRKKFLSGLQTIDDSPWFVTLVDDRSETRFTGSSYQAALYELIAFIPGGHVVTGSFSPSDPVTDIKRKIQTAIANKQRLVVANGQAQEVANMKELLSSQNVPYADEQVRFEISWNPLVVFSSNVLGIKNFLPYLSYSSIDAAEELLVRQQEGEVAREKGQAKVAVAKEPLQVINKQTYDIKALADRYLAGDFDDAVEYLNARAETFETTKLDKELSKPNPSYGKIKGLLVQLLSIDNKLTGPKKKKKSKKSSGSESAPKPAGPRQRLSQLLI